MMERLQIPVLPLGSYRVDSRGRVFKKGDPDKLKELGLPLSSYARDTALKGLTFLKAMEDWAGDKNGIDKLPWPLMPGVWQLRFGGDLQPPNYCGGNHKAYLDKHALGPNRIHPDEWPPWNERTSAAAAAFVGTARDERCWFSITLKSTEIMSAARKTHLDTFEPSGDGSREHYPYLVMGKIAFAAIDSIGPS